MGFFVSPRPKTYVSTAGHAIEFEKDKPTWVPPHLHREVSDFADPVDTADAPPEDDGKVVGTNEPTDPEQREGDMLAAMELLTTRNARGDFTAAGAPHMAALAQILGWKPEAKERDAVWVKFQAGDRS